MMKQMRKRSGTRPSSTAVLVEVVDNKNNNDDSNSMMESNPMRVRVRQSSSSPPRLWRTDVFLLGIGFVLYAISCLSYFARSTANTASTTGSSTTFDRVLHHKNVPFGTLDISSSISESIPPTVSHKFIPQRPRMIGFYFDSPQSDTPIGATETLNANKIHFRSRQHENNMTKGDLSNIARQEALRNSRDYRTGRAEQFETEDCKAQYSWQKRSYPTCNHVLEQDWTQLESESVRILAHGYWRDVWNIPNNGKDRMVLKTLRYGHEFQERNYDRHRRDAIAMEQLTSSRWVINIYGFCGNSGLFEFADGGSLDDSIFSDEQDGWTTSETLIVAYQIASGIAAVHNHPNEGSFASIAHTDITTSQFVYVGAAGVYKLNDFNRCRFIRWDNQRNESCPFHVRNNPGTFRSPEEYAYEDESEKIDVYSMGNVFYSLLTGLWPFEKLPKSSKAAQLVQQGHRPQIPEDIATTKDMFQQVLVNATRACWIHDPKERPTSRQIQQYIEKHLVEQGIPKS